MERYQVRTDATAGQARVNWGSLIRKLEFDDKISERNGAGASPRGYHLSSSAHTFWQRHEASPRKASAAVGQASTH